MMQIGVRLGPDVVRLGPMGSDWVISHTQFRKVCAEGLWRIGLQHSALYLFGRFALESKMRIISSFNVQDIQTLEPSWSRRYSVSGQIPEETDHLDGPPLQFSTDDMKCCFSSLERDGTRHIEAATEVPTNRGLLGKL